MRYIGATEAAKMIRKVLKTTYPDVKFSVKTSKYSGGASIDIRWSNGPTKKQVEEVAVHPFQSKSFDGMIDMAVSHYHWLLPDGTVVYGGTEGTEGSGGTIPRVHVEKPHPDAEKVHFGSHYIFCERQLTDSFIEKCGAAWDQLTDSEQCDLINKHLNVMVRDFNDKNQIARALAYILPA